ncbi:MAG: hypothetical protein HW380_4009, partial [Magnetococcales bacterium]|nr:hypothetical protein [Magnetococcales bacterium]
SHANINHAHTITPTIFSKLSGVQCITHHCHTGGRDFTQKAIKNIGYPGGTIPNASVFTDGTYWYWSDDFKNAANPRRLNWFGLFKKDEGVLQISVEINTAYEERNDRVAGFFARDINTKLVYLLHSGRVGGGVRGVGRSTFLAWSDPHLVDVVDSSGGVRKGVLVMPIDGKTASRSAVRYVDTIARFKQAVRAGDMETPEFQRKKKEYDDFYSEARGRRKGRRPAEIDYLSRHGDIVDALNSWRMSEPLPKGGRLVKNVMIDMGVEVDSDLVEVFEVKTSTARSDVYGAIGQLMVHGTAADCRRAIILPHREAIADDLKGALQRLSIELLTFKLDEQKATIL